MQISEIGSSTWQLKSNILCPQEAKPCKLLIRYVYTKEIYSDSVFHPLHLHNASVLHIGCAFAWVVYQAHVAIGKSAGYS